MKKSQSPPSSRSRHLGDFNSMDTYFKQLTAIDVEYLQDLLPAESHLDDAIVPAIITEVFKLEKSGFRCIKRTKRLPRTSLPLQSDWLKLIEEKEHRERGETANEEKFTDHAAHHTKQGFSRTGIKQ